MSWPLKVSILAEEPNSLAFLEAISSVLEKVTQTLLPAIPILRVKVPSSLTAGPAEYGTCTRGAGGAAIYEGKLASGAGAAAACGVLVALGARSVACWPARSVVLRALATSRSNAASLVLTPITSCLSAEYLALLNSTYLIR